ncbi:MAG: hypothetical protein M1828_001080 [Chrysothrix sp. TS-e1954]|nr:MAG: hypothetical protein M1828_001080 [Chrysothrix sp. TS-e1954]
MLNCGTAKDVKCCYRHPTTDTGLKAQQALGKRSLDPNSVIPENEGTPIRQPGCPLGFLSCGYRCCHLPSQYDEPYTWIDLDAANKALPTDPAHPGKPATRKMTQDHILPPQRRALYHKAPEGLEGEDLDPHNGDPFWRPGIQQSTGKTPPVYFRCKGDDVSQNPGFTNIEKCQSYPEKILACQIVSDLDDNGFRCEPVRSEKPATPEEPPLPKRPERLPPIWYVCEGDDELNPPDVAAWDCGDRRRIKCVHDRRDHTKCTPSPFKKE